MVTQEQKNRIFEIVVFALAIGAVVVAGVFFFRYMGWEMFLAFLALLMAPYYSGKFCGKNPVATVSNVALWAFIAGISATMFCLLYYQGPCYPNGPPGEDYNVTCYGQGVGNASKFLWLIGAMVLGFNAGLQEGRR